MRTRTREHVPLTTLALPQRPLSQLQLGLAAPAPLAIPLIWQVTREKIACIVLLLFVLYGMIGMSLTLFLNCSPGDEIINSNSW